MSVYRRLRVCEGRGATAGDEGWAVATCACACGCWGRAAEQEKKGGSVVQGVCVPDMSFWLWPLCPLPP